MQLRKRNRGAFLNFLRAHYDRMTEATVVGSYPYVMWIDPASICNLRCPICPTGRENESRRAGKELHLRSRSVLSRYLYDSILDEMGEYLFILGLYNWGEPLLNRELPYFIRRAAQADICTEIHTNLSVRLSDEAMKELLLSGISVIAASIDGFSQETYQRYRVGGDFALAKGNIERLAALKKELGTQTMIIWMCLVFSFNEREVAAMDGYCRERGIIFSRREAFIDIAEKPEWLPSYRRKELEQGAPPPAGRARGNGPLPAGTRTCAWHYSHAVVNADGSVSPCCAAGDQKHDFGTLTAGPPRFADIWNNERFVKSREALGARSTPCTSDIATICGRCPYEVVKDQYSPWDEFILKRFWEAGFSDRPLRKAFSLLTRSPRRFVRYMERKGMAAGG